MTPGRRREGDGLSKTQRLALTAARTGKLFETANGLRMRDPGHRTLPVRSFGPAVVKACVKAGWAMKIEQDDGSFRIVTTLAGDTELVRALRLARRVRVADDWEREALR